VPASTGKGGITPGNSQKREIRPRLYTILPCSHTDVETIRLDLNMRTVLWKCKTNSERCWWKGRLKGEDALPSRKFSTGTKVTIRPDFTGTVLNFDGLSRENYEVSQDAELSRITNPVSVLSRFECDVTSHVDKVYT